MWGTMVKLTVYEITVYSNGSVHSDEQRFWHLYTNTLLIEKPQPQKQLYLHLQVRKAA
jgi:hypothetical protein